MDLNFEIFMIALLVLSILVVGNFLRDGESNYLEGALLVVSNARREDRTDSDADLLDRVYDHCCSGMVLSRSRFGHVEW